MTSIIKCKMCGGDLNIQIGVKVAECMYCGSMQTIPNIDDERRANLYARAGQFRLNGDFDKAASIYDEILRDDNTDAEAHWSIVLCKYGIEYVQDPKTRRRIPTVNRMQYTSIFNDPDYRETIKYADSQQRQVYEYEAQIIDSIQNGILEISRKENPFDIFISYKETDSLGRRTQDSVYAHDIYERLTQEGYRVFFSRVTLESVVGTAYEPYIFAALNSAKVMIVVGTSVENMNAVWVRNEWSRFLLLMQQDKSKSLIPVYKDMNPYELPAEFAYLQAQDMNRLGFIQDLVRGINKIIKGDKDTKKNVISTKGTTDNVASVESLLKRVDQFIDAGDWKSAEEYCNRILDIDPECAFAHFNLFCCKNKLKSRKEILEASEKFEKDESIKNAIKYANAEEKDFLLALKEECKKHVQEKQKIIGKKRKNFARTLLGIICAIAVAIGTYMWFVARPRIIYSKAEEYFSQCEYEEALEQYSLLKGFGDSKEKIDICEEFLKIQNYELLDEVTFGNYQWIVIAKENNRCLLISKDGVAEKPFDDAKDNTSCYWENCTLRKWLNNDFYSNFSDVEKNMIIESHLTQEEPAEAESHLKMSIKEFDDKLFLLSKDEVEQYLLGKYYFKLRKIEYEGEQGWWWLRDSGRPATLCRAVVLQGGEVSDIGKTISDISGIVRPAMWIKNNGGESKKTESQDLIDEINNIGKAEIDSIVSYGDNNWIVLDKSENEALLLSVKSVAGKKYNEEYAAVTWENCSLRKWLNNEFIRKTFSEEEYYRIKETELPEYSNLKDKVFILSQEEADEYHDILLKKGGDVESWYRTPGENNYYVKTSAGEDNHRIVTQAHVGVRPVICINTEIGE